MITDEELLARGLGAMLVGDPLDDCRIEPVDGLDEELRLNVNQGERLLLLAGYSLYKHSLGYAWIISDDPENEDWKREDFPNFFTSERGSPIYVDDESVN